MLIETFGELVQNFVINEDAWSSSRIIVQASTLLSAGGSKERRTLKEGDRGGHTVWYKFTEISKTSQICDILSLLITFPVLLRCGSYEDVNSNLVISSVVLKPSPIIPCEMRNVQICGDLSKENIQKKNQSV